MTTTLERLCGALVAAAFLLLTAPVSGADDDALQPDAGVEKARTLLGAGRYDEALDILLPLAQSYPEDTNIQFQLALAAMEASGRPNADEAEREALLDAAIATLRRILVDQPGLVRVRLELARAFFLKGDDDLARRHFEQVLAGDLPDAVVANVRRFLVRIRARRRWSMYAGAALLPDSNIGASSDEEIIYIYDLPFRRDADELTTSGVGLSMWTGGEYQRPLGERLRLRAGVSASRQEHSGSAFDVTNLSGHVGPRWLVDGNTEASLLASAVRRWSGGRTDYDDVGARLEAKRRLTPLLTVNARSSWHRRDYERRDHLDGHVADLSLTGSLVVTPVVRTDLSTGYSRERPESVRWRNTSHRIRAGVTVVLPLGFNVGGSVQLRRTAYQGNWFPFTRDGSPREDSTRTLSVSLLNRTFTMYGFSPQLVVTHEARDSTAQLHGFDRTSGEVRLVRQF